MPPLRSIRIIRRICRNLKLRSADVAKTLPWEPAASTAMEAISTMMSVGGRYSSQGLLPRGGINGLIDMQGHVGPWESGFQHPPFPPVVSRTDCPALGPSQHLGLVSYGLQLQVSGKKEFPEVPTLFLSLSPLWPRQKQLLPKTQL